MPYIGVADLFESLFHLVNPATAREALGGLNRGLLFRSGKDWSGFRGLAGEAGRRAWGGTRSAWNMSYEGGMPMLIGGTAFAAAIAPRGHKASAAAAFAITSPLSAIPGALLAGTAGAVVGGFVHNQTFPQRHDRPAIGRLIPVNTDNPTGATFSFPYGRFGPTDRVVAENRQERVKG